MCNELPRDNLDAQLEMRRLQLIDAHELCDEVERVRTLRNRELTWVCVVDFVHDGVRFEQGVTRVHGSHPVLAIWRDSFTPISSDGTGDIRNSPWPGYDPHLPDDPYTPDDAA